MTGELHTKSDKNLEMFIAEASKELRKRKQLTTGWLEIKKVMRKHGITSGELRQLLETSKSTEHLKRSQQGEKGKTIKSVPPKFFNPNSSEAWSGRGLAPKWVQKVCEQESISVAEFKMTKKYMRDSSS